MELEVMIETNGGEPWTTNGDPATTKQDYNNHGYGGANNMASAAYAQNLTPSAPSPSITQIVKSILDSTQVPAIKDPPPPKK